MHALSAADLPHEAAPEAAVQPPPAALSHSLQPPPASRGQQPRARKLWDSGGIEHVREMRPADTHPPLSAAAWRLAGHKVSRCSLACLIRSLYTIINTINDLCVHAGSTTHTQRAISV